MGSGDRLACPLVPARMHAGACTRGLCCLFRALCLHLPSSRSRLVAASSSCCSVLVLLARAAVHDVAEAGKLYRQCIPQLRRCLSPGPCPPCLDRTCLLLSTSAPVHHGALVHQGSLTNPPPFLPHPLIAAADFFEQHSSRMCMLPLPLTPLRTLCLSDAARASVAVVHHTCRARVCKVLGQPLQDISAGLHCCFQEDSIQDLFISGGTCLPS